MPKRPYVLTAIAVFAALGAPVSAAADMDTRTPSHPVYALTLRSDASGTHWRGREQVTFQNDGTVPLPTVWIRLWDNGLRGCGLEPIRITDVTGGQAGPLGVDCSALPVDLPGPLQPGATTTIAFDLAIAVPKGGWRFGRAGSEVFAGNAIPLLAIEDAAGWHLDPYTELGDSFYSQVGDFRVTFDSPRRLRIASTGVVVARHALAGGRIARTVVAHDVRDFAWAAGPLREVSAVSHGVRLRAWYPRTLSIFSATTALYEAESALESFSSEFGAYPYPELDIVLAYSPAGDWSEEYPTIVFTTLNEPFLVDVVAHQWWYGIVGDDEYGEPWLDEAFALWSQFRHDGRSGSLCDDVRYPSPGDRVSLGMQWWDDHRSDYGPVVYLDGACALQSLSDLLGKSRFDAMLHAYVAAHRFGWSTTADFQAAAQAAASQLSPPVDLTSFWAQHRIG